MRYRKSLALAITSALFSHCLSALDSLPLTPAEKAIETFLEREGAEAQAQAAKSKTTYERVSATIVAFDHRLQTWSVLRWSADGLTKLEGPVEKPEVSLRKTELLRAFVIDTDPLIFTADRSATAEGDISSLTTLQQLAAGLGGLVTTGLQLHANNASWKAVVEDFPNIGQVNALWHLDQSPDPTAFQALIEAVPALTATPQAEILTYSAAFISALDEVDVPLTDLDSLKKAAKGLEATLENVQEEALLGWLQAVESEVSLVAPPPRVELATVATQFRDLEAGRKVAAAIAVPCADAVAKLAEMVLQKRTPLQGSDAVARLDAFHRSVLQIDDNLADQGCSAELGAATTQIKIWLIANPPTPSGPVDQGEIDALRNLSDSTWTYLEMAGKVSGALAKAKTLAESQPKIIAAVARINRFLDRHAAWQARSAQGELGVLEINRSSFVGESVRWSKTRTDTVEVALDESLAGKLTLSHPTKASGTFLAKRRSSDGLALDFAVIRTELYSSTFAAEDDDGTDGGTSTIIEKDRATRSGKVALMASYRFPLGGGFGIGPTIGVGLDSDAAAFFAGLSANWSFLVLGVGETWQKVSELNGQIIGGTLEEGQEVKTRDHFERDRYYSLAISIRDLPFFKPKEAK